MKGGLAINNCFYLIPVSTLSLQVMSTFYPLAGAFNSDQLTPEAVLLEFDRFAAALLDLAALFTDSEAQAARYVALTREYCVTHRRDRSPELPFVGWCVSCFDQVVQDRQALVQLAQQHPGVATPPQRIGELMTTEVCAVAPSTRLPDAYEFLLQSGRTHVVAVDRDYRPQGMVSVGELSSLQGSERKLASSLQQQDPAASERTLAEVMRSPVVTVEKKQPIAVATDRLVKHALGALPVVEESGRLVGLLTVADVLRKG